MTKLTKAETQTLIDLGARCGYINSADKTGYFSGSRGKRPSKGLADTFRKLEGRGLVFTHWLDDSVTLGVYLTDEGKALCAELTPQDADETAQAVKCAMCFFWTLPFEFNGKEWGQCTESPAHVLYFGGDALPGQSRFTPEADGKCQAWKPKQG